MALTLISTQDIIDAVGTGANATLIASAAILTRYGEQAEGDVCTETRRDWITGYASVNANVKNKLKTAVASLAAMRIAKWDRTGYFSKDEQQTIIDMLDADYNKAIKLLSELDANNIRGVTA